MAPHPSGDIYLGLEGCEWSEEMRGQPRDFLGRLETSYPFTLLTIKTCCFVISPFGMLCEPCPFIRLFPALIVWVKDVCLLENIGHSHW